MTRVAIIGGGVTGLSLAHYLEHAGENLEIALFDPGERLGGKIQTERRDGLVIEQGADSILLKQGSPLDKLIDVLELRHLLISPQRRTFSIQRDGVLHNVPLGILHGFPKNLSALWECSLFSTLGKCSAMYRPIIDFLFPKTSKGDPSIAESLRHRYGREVSNYLFETVFGGIHSGDASKLSFRSLYPEMAKSRRSLWRKKNGGKYTGARFVSFPEGMATLIEALEESLQSSVVVRAEVSRILHAQQGGFDLLISGGQFHFDRVVVATPAHAAASLVADMSPRLQEALLRIRHSTSAIVTLLLPKSSLATQPEGSGYLMAPSEQGAVTGCTFSSEKWSDRAPEELLLARIFFGRNGGAGSLSDKELEELALSEVREKLGFSGEPSEVVVRRWTDGLPQYERGHEEKLQEIHQHVASLEGLYLTGTSYRGVGIPDCVRQAYETASEVLKDIDSDTVSERSSAGGLEQELLVRTA